MTFLIPSGFFGTTAATKTWWTDIARKAWQETHWHGVLDELDLIPADSKPGPIVVWNYDRRDSKTDVPGLWYTEKDCWQLNWILESLPADYDELLNQPELHLRLVLDAMKHPWFCLGMLEGDPRFLPFLYSGYKVHEAGEEVHERVTRPLLRAFLRRFSEIVTLDDRIATASGRFGVKVVGVREQMSAFLDLAKYCGALTEDDWFKIPEYPLDVVIERMNRIQESLGDARHEEA